MTENTLDSTAPGPCAALSHSRSSGLVHRVPSNLSPRHPSGGSLSGSCPLPPAPSHLLSGHFAACFLLPVTLLLKKSKGHRRLSAKVQGLSRQPWRWTPPGLLLAEVVSLTSPDSCLTVGAVLSVLLPLPDSSLPGVPSLPHVLLSHLSLGPPCVLGKPSF